MKQIFILITAILYNFIPQYTQAQDYWQQEVHTRINVHLDDAEHFLHGREEIDYINHSPDTLRHIYIHLWPNAYKNDRTAYTDQQIRHRETGFYFAKEKDRGYIDSLDFQINGSPVNHSSSITTPDIARIELPEPLLPGAKIQITTPFRVKLPKVFSRLGHTGQAYFISQWFPKPAVYDRKGWHPLPYLNYGEFYSEVGTYDVTITLPRNYIVMATGNCVDDAENAWLDSLARAPLPADTLYKNSRPASDPALKTIRFREENVHDFAWFADKRWVVRKDTVMLPGTATPVTTYAAFLPGSQKQWIKATDYLRGTVRHYSDFVGAYPYRTIKAVEGDMHAGGGMEYPTITVIDKAIGAVLLKRVLVHEAGHNWFYGILATNERDHAWMDEGINTFYEKKTIAAMQQDSSSAVNKFMGSLGGIEGILYFQSAAARVDQPLEQTSANFTELNYGAGVYQKTGLMLEWLEAYMEPEVFRTAMHDYYNTWKFKHPYPEDFRAILEKHTDKPLGWFFDGALQTDQPVDFKIKSVRKDSEQAHVTLRNRSDFAAPAAIDVLRGDSVITSVWSLPFAGDTTLSVALPTGWTKMRVPEAIPDIKPANSIYRSTGLIRKSGIKPGVGMGLNMGERERIWLTPAIGYNYYDGFHAGLLLHNLTVPETRFRFAVAPLYSFGSRSFNGAGSMGYFWYPKRVFHNILLQGDIKRFSNDVTISDPVLGTIYNRYLKIAPGIQFTFREKDPLSTVTRRLSLKAYHITEDQAYFALAAPAPNQIYSTRQEKYIYGLLRYQHHNDRTFNPFSYALEAQGGEDFIKLNLEGRIRIDYHIKNKGLHLRGFAGKFFTLNNAAPAVTERYWLNTTYTGINDYLYDDTYLARSETRGLGARQVSMREGGFKIPTNRSNPPTGRSDDWLATLNIETDVPWVPLRLFLDIGTFANAAKFNPNGNTVLYNGGVSLHIIPDIFVVYVPLIMSRDFRDYQKATYGKEQFLNSIAFSLQLHNINWLRTPATLLKKAGG